MLGWVQDLILITVGVIWVEVMGKGGGGGSGVMVIRELG